MQGFFKQSMFQRPLLFSILLIPTKIVNIKRQILAFWLFLIHTFPMGINVVLNRRS